MLGGKILIKTDKKKKTVLGIILLVIMLFAGRMVFFYYNNSVTNSDIKPENPTRAENGMVTWDMVCLGSYPQSDAAGE